MYKAFISYTLEDKTCAQRLERELLMLADWRTLELCRKYQAHEGKKFKVIQKEGSDRFATVGEGAVLKFWGYRNGEIECLSTIQLRVRYKNPQKELFKKFDLNGISGTNAACLDSSGNICAVITGDQVSMVELKTGNVWILDIPDRLVTNVPEMNWNWIAFAEDDNYLFIGNGYLFTRQGKYLGERIVCDREAVKPLSEEELALPQAYSSLLFDHVNRVKNPDLFHILGFAFLDEKRVVVSCEKEKCFIWNIETGEWKECGSEQQTLFRDAQGQVENIFPRNAFAASYVSQDGMREVKCQGKTLSFRRKKDHKVMLHLDFPHNVDAFYFSEDERLLLIWGEKRIFRYEIPCFPDDNKAFVENLFVQRRETVQ